MSPQACSSTDDKLRHRLAIDAAAATVAAALVTPAVTIMDRIVVERSCANRPVLESFKEHLMAAIRKPGQFAISRPSLLVFGLYLVTFGAANSTSTISDSRFLKLEPTVAKATTTLATLSVNVPLGIYKDIVFARLFGCTIPHQGNSSQISMVPRAPPFTYVAFLLRDAVTIYTSFTLPGIVSSYVSDATPSHPQSKAVVAQLFVPALGQVSNTPIHLIGLEVYNKQGSVKFSDILSVIRSKFLATSMTRMCRIIPAFGLGTLTNNELRDILNSNLSATIFQQALR